MALVRCDDHKPKETRTKHVYVKSVKPVNSPNDALICGVQGCLKGGCLVHLCEPEADAYTRGERFFSTRVSQLSGTEAKTGAKVRVS